jgi:hypothetical protein
MFFRPGNPEIIVGQQQPGLEGFAPLLVRGAGTFLDHNAVRVRINLRVRANLPGGHALTGGLAFFKRNFGTDAAPAMETVAFVEPNQINITPSGGLEIDPDPDPTKPAHFSMSLFRTTVLQETFIQG